MEKIFKLKENGTNVKTEILAGLTTFMTMAYIIALNPNLLTGFDVGSQLWNGVFLATCIAWPTSHSLWHPAWGLTASLQLLLPTLSA